MTEKVNSSVKIEKQTFLKMITVTTLRVDSRDSAGPLKHAKVSLENYIAKTKNFQGFSNHSS